MLEVIDEKVAELLRSFFSHLHVLRILTLASEWKSHQKAEWQKLLKGDNENREIIYEIFFVASGGGKREKVINDINRIAFQSKLNLFHIQLNTTTRPSTVTAIGELRSM